MRVYAFLGGMWILMILGGGLAVLVLGPLDFPDARWLNSPVKAAAALLMAVLWVYILVRIQRYML